MACLAEGPFVSSAGCWCGKKVKRYISKNRKAMLIRLLPLQRIDLMVWLNRLA